MKPIPGRGNGIDCGSDIDSGSGTGSVNCNGSISGKADRWNN